jgi:hypothetical protein
MNDATLRQATANAKDAAENLKDVAQDAKARVTGADDKVADDVEATAKEARQAAKDAGDAAKHVDDAAKAARLAATPAAALDDIERIERRMNERRAAIRSHLNEARETMERTVQRTAKSWPIVATGAVVAALAVGYVVAQRARPSSRAERTARTLWDRARHAPEAARKYVHEATKPPSRVWTERVAAGTGVAMAVMRTLPQLRALIATIQQMQGSRRARP